MIIIIDWNNWYENFRCKKWVVNTRRAGLEKKTAGDLYKNYFLCAEHFEVNQFTNDPRNRLNWNAVPTVFTVCLYADCR